MAVRCTRMTGSRRYTSVAILNAERRILGEAACQDFRIVQCEAVDLALLEAVANGVRLGPDQAEMVRQLATSGARVQLALAPAGSGKTVTLRALANAWAVDGNTVIGLAPTAAAGRVLRDELGNSVTATDTLAKLVHALSTGSGVPEWVEAIGPGSLVIVDEAGWPARWSWPKSSTTPPRGARQSGWSAMTGNCRVRRRRRAARPRRERRRRPLSEYAASPTPTHPDRAGRRLAGDPPRRPAALGSTSTTSASTSATTRPPPIRRSPPGRPTAPQASTRCSSRPPTRRSAN